VKIIESNGFTLDGRSLTDTFLKNLARTFRKSRTLQSVGSGVQAHISIIAQHFVDLERFTLVDA
jgi:hypothetical protein